MKSDIRYTIALFIVTLFWGMSYVLTKVCLDHVSELQLITMRFSIAFVVSSCALAKHIFPISKQDAAYSFLLSLLLFTVLVSMTTGVKHTSASNAGFIASLSVIFIPVFSHYINKEKIQKTIWYTLPVALFGIALLTLNEEFQLNYGDILCLICAVTFGLHVVFTGRFAARSNPVLLGVMQFFFIALLSALAQLCMGESFRLRSGTGMLWLSVLTLSVLCTAFGFIVQTAAQKKISCTMTGLILSLEPVFSALFGYVVLGETLSARQLFGALLVLGVIVWVSIRHQGTRAA